MLTMPLATARCCLIGSGVGIGVAGAYAIYYVGGLIDDVWERVKKQIFE